MFIYENTKVTMVRTRHCHINKASSEKPLRYYSNAFHIIDTLDAVYFGSYVCLKIPQKPIVPWDYEHTYEPSKQYITYIY